MDAPADSSAAPSAAEDRTQRRAAQNEVLSASRSEMNRQKTVDSLKRFSYLLGQTELFQHFIDIKKDRDPEFAALLDESAQQRTKKRGRGADQRHHRKSEREEDAELLHDEDAPEEDETFVFRESPGYVKGGTMKEYQVQGLNWLVSLYQNGINGILADEMGLGKTLQTISFLGYLKYYRDTPGLHLVVVPKSTLDNWTREFEKWVPGFRIITLQGSKEERQEVIQQRLLPQDFDVLITTYEICLREKPSLQKMSWEYIVIDEAHRIKNVDSALSQIMRAFTSRSRLLITGTPLQNNLMELWSLLNFLLPDVFSSADDFQSWFQGKDAGDDEQHGSIVEQLHKVLRLFLLRRVKADVEHSLLPKKEINVFVGLTDMQRQWYKSLLAKDIDAVNGALSKKEGKTRLLNIVMQLRKCCNHPYLFDGAEPGPPYTTDEHLVDNSGKLAILDKLLKKMKERGSRVLIFSQMSRMLDILEDYCLFREFKYCRIDGGSAHEDRIAAIDEYNKPDSDKFVFLLTTRAGGLGINLTTADIVVLFDSDWNPQADLQAMDRAHRIGQKKQVYVYRLVTDNSIEERILERAAQKLRLDQLVIQQGRAASQAKGAQMKEDLVDMIQHGADRIINSKESMEVSDDIDDIIARGEARTKELQAKYQQFTSLDELTQLRSESAYAWDGEDHREKKRSAGIWIEPAKRERKQNYSIDSYYRDAMRTTAKPAVPKAPRAPKQVPTPEWQFFPPRLLELQAQETAAYQRSLNYQVPAASTPEGEKQRAEEQARIDTGTPHPPSLQPSRSPRPSRPKRRSSPRRAGARGPAATFSSSSRGARSTAATRTPRSPRRSASARRARTTSRRTPPCSGTRCTSCPTASASSSASRRARRSAASSSTTSASCAPRCRRTARRCTSSRSTTTRRAARRTRRTRTASCSCASPTTASAATTSTSRSAPTCLATPTSASTGSSRAARPRSSRAAATRSSSWSSRRRRTARPPPPRPGTRAAGKSAVPAPARLARRHARRVARAARRPPPAGRRCPPTPRTPRS